MWSNPRPSEDEVRRYYSNEYRLAYKGRATPSLRHTARSGRGAIGRYRALLPFLKEGDRVLDAGAGGGEVVYVLRRFGFDAIGLEPDEQYARHAREVLDVPVETGFVQDASFPSGRFDVVTMYHALEHVEDPLAILTRLRSWMVEGGVLMIEVPNVEATCMAPAHRFHFAHLYNFSGGTLTALGRRAGFDPLQMMTSPDGGNLIGVFRAAGSGGPARDHEHYVTVAAAVRAHTTRRYYTSRFPYIGPFRRLRTYIADRGATRGCQTPKDVLDALIDRSSDPQ